MTRKFLIHILMAGLLVAAACSEESNPQFDEKTFTKIYDNNQFNASFFPIDFKQTSDGGYLVLGGRRLPESNFSGIYLLKTDKYGNFVKEMEI
ncbi:MAG: hypothetical protein HC859_06680, partial [Bacteroidia bacterium]|nr:hypothetical protein [Bacteroidia bacterium]